MSQTVYITVGGTCHSGGVRSYHTREDCSNLQDAQTIRTTELAALGEGFEHCVSCQHGGSPPKHNGRGEGHYEDLLRAAKEGWSP